MMSILQRSGLVCLAMWMASASLSAEPQTWIYEGLITQADPALAPDLQSGWVLSGSFIFEPLDLEEDIPADDLRSGRLSGGISSGELTVDLYHVVHFEAIQGESMAGFDYRENDRENEGRDLLGWFIPMEGQLKETDWTSRWLQVWLSDPEGKMLRVVPPMIPPDGFEWSAGWFRLTFVNPEGEVAYVEGRMEFFSPMSSLALAEDGWAKAVSDLVRSLEERDRTIDSLRSELATAKDRLDGLRRMVDLLMEERTHLENETKRLQEEVEAIDPGIKAALAEVNSEKALLEDEMGVLKERNVSLAESLSESSLERRRLLERIQELEAASLEQQLEREDPNPAPEPAFRTSPITDSEGNQVGIVTHYEEPPVIVKPVDVQELNISRDRPPEARAPQEIPFSRRPRPRKFR